MADLTTARRVVARRAHEDPLWVQWTLILTALFIMTALVLVPLVNVFVEAFAAGLGTYWENLVGDPDTRHSILLTLMVAPTAVVLNLIFGLAAAWAIARFKFPGRAFLTALIDLPFTVSPVVVGLFLLLLFGLQGFFGPWLREHDIKIVFAFPGLVIATCFVTFPVVARELIPLMEALGAEEEIAAVSLGAKPLQLWRMITLPNIKWGLLYGVILCNARAMGEFGAVFVVSGHIAGKTDTMPLRIEKLFQEYNLPGSFAVASVLALLALVTLLVKTTLEWRTRREIEEHKRMLTLGGEA
jgi:sulfate/thiosulfate transport system permease protein